MTHSNLRSLRASIRSKMRRNGSSKSLMIMVQSHDSDVELLEEDKSLTMSDTDIAMAEHGELREVKTTGVHYTSRRCPRGRLVTLERTTYGSFFADNNFSFRFRRPFVDQRPKFSTVYFRRWSDNPDVMHVAKGTHLDRRKLPSGHLTPTKKKTLVVDLDDTLIHTWLDVEKPSRYDFEIRFFCGETLHTAFVAWRPYGERFLHEANELGYEVTIFSAAIPEYADAVLNVLDSMGKYHMHRRYRRDCIRVNLPRDEVAYVKSLKLLKRDPRTSIIIDNSVYAAMDDKRNALMVRTWVGNIYDRDLEFMSDVLRELAEVDDVRLGIRAILQSIEEQYHH